MKLIGSSRKDIGNYGEKVALEYLRRQGFRLVAKNVVRTMGEIDLIVKKGECLHFVEVKAMLCTEFPDSKGNRDQFDPSVNLHEAKVRKVARMGEWYVAEINWEGEWQVDGVLVWLRERDGVAKVSYLPQIA